MELATPAVSGFPYPPYPGKLPTAAIDRNLLYLGLVEILHGNPFDGVILTTGCDKTTQACIMAAATVNIPAIVYSGGPMVNSYYKGQLAGSGMAANAFYTLPVKLNMTSSWRWCALRHRRSGTATQWVRR